MGGSCQRTWLHAIPKTGRCLGARISVQFRPHWGNDLGKPTGGGRDAETTAVRLSSRRNLYA